jgi:hypothetical protein
MLIDQIKADILSATKLRNTLAANILKVVLSECQRADNTTDDFVIKYCKKLIQANDETIKLGGSVNLSRENELLRAYVPPTATLEEVRAVASTLTLDQSKKSIGTLMSACKKAGLRPEIETINEVLASC